MGTTHYRSRAVRWAAVPKPEVFIQPLLSWFGQSARDLPWRKTNDPYAIWVSEIMLQQTQVKTVIPYWERWMKRFPTVRHLSKASLDEVHKLWEGLGYYSRARNLHRAAEIIVNEYGGSVPSDFAKVIALPGIGRYTAGAICSIAFNQPTPALDGNVIRVFTRLFAIADNPRLPKTNERLWKLAETLVKLASERSMNNPSPQPSPRRTGRGRRVDMAASSVGSDCSSGFSLSPSDRERAGVRGAPPGGIGRGQPNPAPTAENFALHERNCSMLNQALMELGATICTPRQPACLRCPVRTYCRAFREDGIERFPNLSPRAASTRRRFIAFVISAEGRFLVRRRAAGVVNASLWEFPNLETAKKRDAIDELANACLGFYPDFLKSFCSLKHTITRYRISLDVFCGEASPAIPVASHDVRWCKLKQLDQLAFPSAHRKIVETLKARLVSKSFP
jgi:adenine-specific DNA glycosylase